MNVNKLFLVCLLVLLALPIVNAEIKLDSFSYDIYNLGDKILVGGEVNSVSDVRATLDLVLSCNGNSLQVAAVLLDLKAGEPKEYSTFVTLPNSLLGQCKVITTLSDSSGNKLEMKEFAAFDLTNDLNGTFQIPRDKFQLGDTLTLTGNIVKQNQVPIDGVAMTSFKRNGKVLFLDTIEIVDGQVAYSKELTKVPPGIYTLSINVVDNFGNKHDFVDLFTLDLSGSLNITSTLNSNLYNPGDALKLTGYVTNNLNEVLTNLNMNFVFDTIEKSLTLAKSQDPFSVSYDILKNVKSGPHNITVEVLDEKGNYGYTFVIYDVRAVPTVLSLDLSEASYNPQELVSFGTELLDQAGDPMYENINSYLLDSKGNVMGSSVVKTGSAGNILIPQAAKPGIWKLKIDGLGLNDEVLITLKQYQKLDTVLEDTTLVVNNLGNVDFDGVLDLDTGEIKKSKKLNLDVGDAKVFDLKDLFPAGDYNLNIPLTGENFDLHIPEKESLFSGFDGLTGNVVQNTQGTGRRTLLFIALIVIAGCLVYLIIGRTKRRERKIDYSADRGYQLGRKKLEELRAKGIRKDPPRTEYGKATKEDIEDWKQQVQKSFQEQEKRNSEQEFLRHQEKTMDNNKPKGGLFNMFG